MISIVRDRDKFRFVQKSSSFVRLISIVISKISHRLFLFLQNERNFPRQYIIFLLLENSYFRQTKTICFRWTHKMCKKASIFGNVSWMPVLFMRNLFVTPFFCGLKNSFLLSFTVAILHFFIPTFDLQERPLFSRQ